MAQPDELRDVVQEAYLRAYRSIGSFRGDAQFTTWLYRITANCASTHLGRRRKQQHDKGGEGGQPAPGRAGRHQSYTALTHSL